MKRITDWTVRHRVTWYVICLAITLSCIGYAIYCIVKSLH